MRIAIASTDGVNVNQHFGMAKKFYIYESGEKGLEFVEERSTVELSVGDKNHPFDKDRFNTVFEAIKDCQKVYVTKIGERPAAELQKAGAEVVIFDGLIKSI